VFTISEEREDFGFAVGDSEDGAFWTAFLRTLKASGLTGTQLVISDAHTGLKAAIAAVLLGASWQRCRVHFCATCSPASRASAERVDRLRDDRGPGVGVPYIESGEARSAAGAFDLRDRLLPGVLEDVGDDVGCPFRGRCSTCGTARDLARRR
jgi:hypothetical protein